MSDGRVRVELTEVVVSSNVEGPFYYDECDEPFSYVRGPRIVDVDLRIIGHPADVLALGNDLVESLQSGEQVVSGDARAMITHVEVTHWAATGGVVVYVHVRVYGPIKFCRGDVSESRPTPGNVLGLLTSRCHRAVDGRGGRR